MRAGDLGAAPEGLSFGDWGCRELGVQGLGWRGWGLGDFRVKGLGFSGLHEGSEGVHEGFRVKLRAWRLGLELGSGV